MIPIAPPAIPGIGTTGGFEFWIQDTGTGDPVALDAVMQDFLKKARERPELTGLATTYSASTQQLRANVDRDKTQLLGIPIQDVYSAIQAQFGSLTVSQYNLFSNVWWVIVQSDAQYRQNPEDLTRLYTRNNQNQMVPLSSVVTTQWTAGPDLLPHFNGFTAAKINGNAAPGYSSGDAIATMEAVAKEVLPPGYTFAWSGLVVRGEEVGRHVGSRVRVRLHHRVPGAGRAVRIVDAAGRGDDRRCRSASSARSSPTTCAASTTTSTSRSACWC